MGYAAVIQSRTRRLLPTGYDNRALIKSGRSRRDLPYNVRTARVLTNKMLLFRVNVRPQSYRMRIGIYPLRLLRHIRFRFGYGRLGAVALVVILARGFHELAE